jgi:hypothetical protein
VRVLTAKMRWFVVQTEGYMSMQTAAALVFITLFAGTAPARSEQQLPINELYPCEIVLHELIAELTKLRAGAKREAVAALAEDAGSYATRQDATAQTLEKVIRLATAKYDRCP